MMQEKLYPVGTMDVQSAMQLLIAILFQKRSMILLQHYSYYDNLSDGKIPFFGGGGERCAVPYSMRIMRVSRRSRASSLQGATTVSYSTWGGMTSFHLLLE